MVDYDVKNLEGMTAVSDRQVESAGAGDSVKMYDCKDMVQAPGCTESYVQSAEATNKDSDPHPYWHMAACAVVLASIIGGHLAFNWKSPAKGGLEAKAEGATSIKSVENSGSKYALVKK